MRTLTAALSLLLVATACGEPTRDDDDDVVDAGTQPDAGEEVPAEYCAGATTWLWDPPSKRLDAFPDDAFTSELPGSLTGVRVSLVPGLNLDVPASLSRFTGVFTDAGRLDGFGVNAAAYVRFSGGLNRAALPLGGLGSGSADAPVMLVALDGESLEFLDFSLMAVKESASDASTTLVVKPLVPLKPKARYALVVTNDLKDEANGCIAPSETFKAVLDGTATEPGLTRLAPRYAALVEKLVAAGTIASGKELSAATLFTTQSIVEESLAVATDIRSKTIPYSMTSCTAGTRSTRCEGTLEVGDYRSDKMYLEPGPVSATASTLPVSIWLPHGEGPFPTIIYAHGLGGDRSQAGFLEPGAAPNGWAVIGVDAPKHGNHYDPASNPNFVALEFFGLSSNIFAPNLLDTRRLSDNFRQATYDKLQLVRAITAGLDADEDGAVDIDADSLIFAGASLGGIMGPELLALAPEFDLAISMVAGARLADVIADSSAFAQARSLALSSATEGEIARLLAVFQSAVDRADPGSWGPYVLGERLAGLDSQKPQFLMQMVIDDEVVPNSANAHYARSLGLELAGDVLLDIDVASIPSLPASGNLEAGLTGGVYQLDIVSPGTVAEHNTGPGSEASNTQVFHFIGSYYQNGVAEIIDSYRTTGLK